MTGELPGGQDGARFQVTEYDRRMYELLETMPRVAPSAEQIESARGKLQAYAAANVYDPDARTELSAEVLASPAALEAYTASRLRTRWANDILANEGLIPPATYDEDYSI